MFGKKDKTNVLPGDGSSNYSDSQILRDLAKAYSRELKWRRIFKFALLGLVILYVISAMRIAASVGGAVSSSAPHVALVELSGPIGISIGVSADQINQSLRKAFAAKQSKAVVLRVDSPGGTPVQSAEINAEMTRLRAEYPKKPLLVVINELCASGGYYVAVAADSIYANPASIVGSIGVRMDGFGFVGAMEKLGVERRTLTAGTNKALLDPFMPSNPGQVTHLQSMLDDVHQQFIDAVKQGRGDRLNEAADLFTGLVWSGSQAKELGLIDDFGSLDSVARDVVGVDAIVDYSFQPGFLEEFSRSFGVSVGAGIAQKMGLDFGLR